MFHTYSCHRTSLNETDVGMGNDFELNGEKMPFMWKTQLDLELLQSYIEQDCPPGTPQHEETKPSQPSVKETGTSYICQISPSRWRDLIHLISKPTSVPPERVEDCYHDSMKQEICDSNAAPHAVSHSNSPQDASGLTTSSLIKLSVSKYNPFSLKVVNHLRSCFMRILVSISPDQRK